MPLTTDWGVIPCRRLYSCWIVRRRFVSLDGRLHRVRQRVGVEDRLPRDVAGRPSERLDERARRPQESLLVGVQDGHERDLGQVETFPEQVDPDEGVELALPEVPQDPDPVEGLDLRVKVAHPEPELVVVARQVLGHLLGQSRDERPLVLFRPLPDLGHQVVHLALDRPDLDLRVGQAGGPDDLFHDPVFRTSGPRRQPVSPRRR